MAFKQCSICMKLVKILVLAWIITLVFVLSAAAWLSDELHILLYDRANS